MTLGETQCINNRNEGLVHVFEIISICISLLVLFILFILYLFDKVKWQLFSSVLDHLQLVAILPLLFISEREIYQLYFEIMQYTIGPPDLYAIAGDDIDYNLK